MAKMINENEYYYYYYVHMQISSQ